MGRKSIDDVRPNYLETTPKRAKAAKAAAAPAPPTLPEIKPKRVPNGQGARQASRQGMHFMGAWISKEHKRAIDRIAFEHEVEKQDLVRAGLNLVLQTYHMDPIEYPTGGEDS